MRIKHDYKKEKDVPGAPLIISAATGTSLTFGAGATEEECDFPPVTLPESSFDAWGGVVGTCVALVVAFLHNNKTFLFKLGNMAEGRLERPMKADMEFQRLVDAHLISLT